MAKKTTNNKKEEVINLDAILFKCSVLNKLTQII